MIVVADTSVLINLCRVQQDHLLILLFREVVIPTEVAAEFSRLVATVPRFSGLALPKGIRQQAPAQLLSQVLAATGLDAGEAAALSLAVEIHADAVLIDERRGHEVALQLGLRVMGIIGILLEAKAKGHLPAVRPILEALQRDAGFGLPNRCANIFFVLQVNDHDHAPHRKTSRRQDSPVPRQISPRRTRLAH